MASKSMFFNIETTNGRGEKHQYIIPARSGVNAEQQIQNQDLRVQNLGCLGWFDVEIASQQYGNDIVFYSVINGHEFFVYPNQYGYSHLYNLFAEQVVQEKSWRQEEAIREEEEERYKANHPYA
ncbi:TPA: hypothetical protein ACOJPH_001694 [Vibrio campbellii]|uniref:hypothetical protein n=1 Tax=Vibrio campbellii TaxID=680 RepID=UPI003909A119